MSIILLRVVVVLVLAALLALTLRYVPFDLPSYGLYAAVLVSVVAIAALTRPLPVVFSHTASWR